MVSGHEENEELYFSIPRLQLTRNKMIHADIYIDNPLNLNSSTVWSTDYYV